MFYRVQYVLKYVHKYILIYVLKNTNKHRCFLIYLFFAKASMNIWPGLWYEVRAFLPSDS